MCHSVVRSSKPVCVLTMEVAAFMLTCWPQGVRPPREPQMRGDVRSCVKNSFTTQGGAASARHLLDFLLEYQAHSGRLNPFRSTLNVPCATKTNLSIWSPSNAVKIMLRCDSLDKPTSPPRALQPAILLRDVVDPWPLAEATASTLCLNSPYDAWCLLIESRSGTMVGVCVGYRRNSSVWLTAATPRSADFPGRGFARNTVRHGAEVHYL